MSRNPRWPELPEISKENPQAEVKLELYKARLERLRSEFQAGLDQEKEQRSEIQERQKRDYENYYAQLQAVNAGYIEVAKGSIDRSIQRADFLQKVAAAIASVYTTVLALSFAISRDTVTYKNNALPVTGIIPAVFLGISFFLAAVYISFVTNAPDVQGEKSDGTLTGSLDSQRNSFILWNKATVMRRIAWMQAATVSLGVGILLLPIPYLNFPNTTLWVLLGIGLGLIILVPLVVWLVTRLVKKGKPGGIENVPLIHR